MSATGAPKLLVVDDEPSILELLGASLRYAGFEIATASDGRRGLELARTFQPDALVVDVMMPLMDGFDMTRRLRAAGVDAPVLFLTARDATADKIMGLTLGGDDYVTKPFSVDELVARMRALLRRRHGPDSQPPSQLRFADIELDDETHEVSRGGVSIALTPTEFKLLRYFMLNPGRVLSKAKILDHVWQYDFGGEANIVDSYMSLLRRKIDATSPPVLHTLRGVGYVLRIPRA